MHRLMVNSSKKLFTTSINRKLANLCNNNKFKFKTS